MDTPGNEFEATGPTGAPPPPGPQAPSAAPAPGPAAAWYPDPARRHEYRYWDGSAWTGNVSTNGITSWDPPYADHPGQTAAVAPAGYAAAVAPPPAVTRDQRLLHSTSSLATTLGWLLGITAGAVVAHFGAIVYQILAVRAAEAWDESGDPTSIIQRLQNADDLVGATYGILVILWPVVFLLLVIWMFRSARNARTLGRWDNALTPVWSITGWLIPFAHWFMPVTLMQSIWRSAEPEPPVPGARRRRSAAVGVWWACYWLGIISVTVGASVDTETAASAQDLYTIDAWGIAGCALLLASTLALRGTILAIQRRMRAITADAV